MLLPITRPSGSKPACFTSRNSLTDRSLVKKRAFRIPARRSRACCGRSTRGLVVIGVVSPFGGLALSFASLLSESFAVVAARDDLGAPAPKRHHRENERRDPRLVVRLVA